MEEEKGEGKVEKEKKPDTAVPHRTHRTHRAHRTHREGIPDVFNKPLRAKAARLGKRLGGGGKRSPFFAYMCREPISLVRRTDGTTWVAGMGRWVGLPDREDCLVGDGSTRAEMMFPQFIEGCENRSR